MKKIALCIACASLLFASGCAVFLVGAGVAGGYAISKDTARLDKETTFDKAWQVSNQVLESMGTVELRGDKTGRILANVRDSKIEVQITQPTQATVRIEVQARTKYMLPDIDLAMEIVSKINEKL